METSETKHLDAVIGPTQEKLNEAGARIMDAVQDAFAPEPQTDIRVVGSPEARALLWAAMGKARAAFDTVSKGMTGQTGQQKFKYANFAMLSAAMVGPLADNGLAILQMITTPRSDMGCVTTMLAGHGAELWVEIKFPTSDNDHGFQATIKDFGAATTYYKRYQLQAIGFIEGDRDADEQADDMRGPGRVGGEPIKGGVVDPQLEAIREIAEEMGWSRGQVQAFALKLGIKKQLDQMTQTEGKTLIGALTTHQIESRNGAAK